MGAGYSREIEFSATGGSKSCIELPASMRGELDRFLIKQVGGTAAAFDFTIYDRKGACESANDLHTNNGSVVDITDTGGQATVQTAEDHLLKPGDVVEIKGSDQSAYNTMHTVVTVVDSTTFTTDIAYTADGSGGLWQTEPLLSTVDPEMHEVYGPQTVNSGTTHKGTDLNISYENRDNQSSTARRRHSGLWLEIDPDGTGAKDYVCSYTTVADAVV